MNKYPPLEWGARRRLGYFKREAAKPRPHMSGEPRTWRDVRYYKLDSEDSGLSRGLNGKEPIWYSHREYFPEQEAHDVIRNAGRRMDHTGWYTDNDGNELAVGIVVKFPHNRWVAGYRWDSNGERVYFPEIFDSAEDAARAADHHAERFAEDAREHDAKFREASRLEDENEDKLRRLKECIALRNKKCMQYVRDEIHELIEDVKANRERLKTEFEGVL